METVQLKAVARPVFGKGPARQTRRAGQVPAVIYRGGHEAISFALDAIELGKTLEVHRNAIYQLDLSAVGQGQLLGLIREIQRHPLRKGLVHIDFLAIDSDSEVVVKVPIELEGVPEGVRVGGRLRRHERTLSLRCRADAIPAKVVVPVGQMLGGETLLLSKVVPPIGAKIVFRADLAVASVSTIGVEKGEGEEEAAAPAAAAGAKPAAAAAKPAKK